MYDAIVVGSRCAGAPTAMLLARRGRRVLVVDRALFPSDVLSGHTIQPAGVARLARWGLLDRVRATGTPFTSRVRFDTGDVVLDGTPLAIDGIDEATCIRRTVIDPLLTDAAAEAGAEIRLGITVDGLLVDGDRVVGVRAHDGTAGEFEERAPVVVGADGANSLIARSVGAPTYDVRPADGRSVYSYWKGIDLDGIELYVASGPVLRRHSDQRRADDRRPGGPPRRGGPLPGRYRVGVPRDARRRAPPRRAGRRRPSGPSGSGSPGQATTSCAGRTGPGWALVGDAGYHKDPITAQGMLDAFRDAELLAEAIDAGLDGDLEAALAATRPPATPRSRRCTTSPAGSPTLEAPPSADMPAAVRRARRPARPHRPLPGRDRRLGHRAGVLRSREHRRRDHHGPGGLTAPVDQPRTPTEEPSR